MYSTLLLLFSIITTYTDKIFHTECAVEVDAPAAIANQVVDHIITDFQTDPELLFDWALYGAGKQNDSKKEVFLLNYKHTEYNAEEGYGMAVVDIIVPNLTVVKDITLEGRVVDEYGTYRLDTCLKAETCRLDSIRHWSRHVFIDAKYSGNFLKMACGNLYIIPTSDTTSVYYMDMNIRFGWFFKLFISKQTYKNTIEWRVAQYMSNLKNEAQSLLSDEK